MPVLASAVCNIPRLVAGLGPGLWEAPSLVPVGRVPVLLPAEHGLCMSFPCAESVISMHPAALWVSHRMHGECLAQCSQPGMVQ